MLLVFKFFYCEALTDLHSIAKSGPVLGDMGEATPIEGAGEAGWQMSTTQ